ncbi:hypothetical protein Tco_1476139 [Tanacetum coccineum]
MELITPNLACPSTHQLLQNSSGDSGPDLSFDKSASPERLFSLSCVPFSFPLTFSIMAKNDMDLYHSRLTPDDLNDPIIKYKIPRDLHPRLPSEDFVMSELPDDAVDIYHRMVHFSQFGPLGDWFSFAKRCAPSPICIDDNHSCTKHWKSGFFFIDRRAIPDAMVWRHPDAAIDDPRPAAGSFNMADVRCLGAHVIKLRDMPEGVLVFSGLSRVYKSRVYDPVLRGANGNVIGIHDFLCLLEWTGAEVQEEPHLDVRSTLQRLPFYCTPPAAADDAEASQKQKASTSGVTLSHIAKHTSNDDDDDACVEILLVTPLRSTAAIPSSGNHGGSFTTPTAKGSNPRDYRGKGVMVDDAVAPNVSGDAIHMDFFPFSAGPYYATYLKDGVAGNCEFTREETIVDQFPTPREMVRVEMVRVEILSDDQLAAKMIVLHCMMMSHGGELLALFALKKQVSGLNDKLSSFDASFAKSKAKGKERMKKIKSLTKSVDNLHSEVARLSVALNQATFLASDKFSRVQGELLSLAASARLAEASPFIAQTDYAFLNKIYEHDTEPLSVIFQLDPEKLVRPANVPASKEARVSLPSKESTVTPASKSLQLSANVNFTASTVAPEHNEEMVNVEVDGSCPKITDGTDVVKSEHAFVQGISVALDDAVELVEVGSGRVSSDPNDVVVALSAGEKGDGLDPSFVAGEEAAANPSRV